MNTFIEDEHLYRDLYYTIPLNDDISATREMREFSPTGLVAGFSLLSATFAMIAVMIIRCNWYCREFYEWNAIRLTMPGLCLLLSIQNATMAYDHEREQISSQWSIAVYMISSVIAPGIFIFTFVMTFLAYRTRSMPFCFVHRGPGRSGTGESRLDEEDEVYQPLVRPAILVVSTRMFALGLLILNLLVNFDVLSDDSQVGLTGWATVVKNPEGNLTLTIFLALLPMALVSCLCLYFACLIWRYGSEFSMIINTSVFNAWMCPVLGALIMIVGQMFGPNLFLITSNSGILVYMISMTRVLYEIRHDIQQAGDLGNFLIALENARSEKNREDNPSPNTIEAPNSADAISFKIPLQSAVVPEAETFPTSSSHNDEEFGREYSSVIGDNAPWSANADQQDKRKLKIKQQQVV